MEEFLLKKNEKTPVVTIDDDDDPVSALKKETKEAPQISTTLPLASLVYVLSLEIFN